MLQSDEEADESSGQLIRIVGIGASAGGLEAFSELLRALSANTGMAFVLVQHLDPLHDSQLPEILQQTTAMPVQAAMDGMAIKRNRVYVIPPNYNLTVSGNVLHLTPRIAHTLNLPINTLFESLAEQRGRNAIAVVLSGTGNDGSEGLKAIKKRSGITLVQTESRATKMASPGRPTLLRMMRGVRNEFSTCR